MDAKKVWQRALKSELGPTLTWLLDEMADAHFQSESSDFFLLDPPTSERLTSTAQQSKLGLFVLGRTAQGLFGVERTGDAPLDARPVFTAAFKGTERTHAAANIGAFLRGLKGFDAFVAKHASKPMPKASEATPVETPKPAAVKLTKAKALTLGHEQVLVALRKLGPGVTLLVYDDSVECPAARTLQVNLMVNLKPSLAARLAGHAFVKSVAEAVRAHVARATGYKVEVDVGFDPLEPDDEAQRLLPILEKTGHAEVVAFLKEAIRAE